MLAGCPVTSLPVCPLLGRFPVFWSFFWLQSKFRNLLHSEPPTEADAEAFKLPHAAVSDDARRGCGNGFTPAGPRTLGSADLLFRNTSSAVSAVRKERPELTSCYCLAALRNVNDCANICSKFPFQIRLENSAAGAVCRQTLALLDKNL